MARSKVSTKPAPAAPPAPPVTYKCLRCGRTFKKQNTNFFVSQSPMWRYNNGYVPVCKHCLEELYFFYREHIGDDKEAVRRTCMKFDLYWNEHAYNIASREGKNTGFRIGTYFTKTNLGQYKGKTFDDTLDEEEIQRQALEEILAKQPKGPAITLEDLEEVEEDELIVDPKSVEFWGVGLAKGDYAELDQRLDHWVAGRDVNDIDLGELGIIKQICMLEVQINHDFAAGKSIEKSTNALNNLYGSANFKPVQKVTDKSNSIIEGTPFGVWIKHIENDEPIAEAAPEFQDVDGIIKYISVWYLGHLCKMLNVNNSFSELYEAEIAKLTVERPEYEGMDEDEIMEDIFERANRQAEVKAREESLGSLDEGGDFFGDLAGTK